MTTADPLDPRLDVPRQRKATLRSHFDRLARSRSRWVDRNRYFYRDEEKYFRFLVPDGKRVLEVGSGDGRLLAHLRPSHGVGVDISRAMIDVARAEHPDLTFVHGDVEDEEIADLLSAEGPFDVIVVSDSIGYLHDIQGTLSRMRGLCTPRTRIIISYYSQLWRPGLRLAERMKLKMPSPRVAEAWLASEDIASLLELSGYEVVKREYRMLVPRRLLGIGEVANRMLAPLPGLRRLCLRDYVVARPAPEPGEREELSVTVLVPARNEAGNVEAAVVRLPEFGREQEIMFVEGNSSDNTVEEIHRVQEAYPERNITFYQQPGRGKGDAVRTGFDNAQGEVLMILDADLTVPPEDMPKFYDLIASGRAEFVNGSRLVYPLEPRAMRRLNFVANHLFAQIFSWLLNQRFTDTLCGTKVIRKSDYQDLVRGRSYFGDFDPFGDFDLIFGASKLNLRIREVPVRYADRAYGEPQISRFRDGWQLTKMVAFAWRKLKAL